VPGQSGDYFTRMQAETSAVRQAQADLSVALNQREELQRQLRGERQSAVATPAAAAGPNAPTTDTAVRLAEAQKRLDELLLRFTDKHPDVAATRDAIRQLQERQEQELRDLREGKGPATASLAASPVYQNIQMTLNQVEVQIASLRSRIGQGQSNIAQLQRLANTAPEVEADYSKLTRDYEVTRAQYNSLLERLERARLSEDAEQTGIVRFEVIDPPVAPLEPVAPNRPMLVAVLLAIALAAGAGLAYLMHVLRPVFSNVRTLTEVSGRPVLGAISVIWAGDRALARRKEVLALGGAFAGLLAVFVVVFTWQAWESAWFRNVVG
jgi:polysaccharide chain length determinant protein (PEP-CTERM system associated)